MILICGAGLSGAVIARRLADEGLLVTIIDKRSHIAGNLYDYVDQYGQRIHAYGPHLLHGDEDSVAIRFLSRFTDWVPYEHRVKALLPSGQLTTLPVNITTFSDVYGRTFDTIHDSIEFIKSVQQPILNPANSDEVFLASFGEKVANILFRPYTRKMWGVDPSDLEASIGGRIPVRLSADDRYFSDTFQALPRNGYTAMVEQMIDHPNIKTMLNTEFDHSMIDSYDHSFLCIPIDRFFGMKHGELPYRSIKFEKRFQAFDNPAVTVNFTDEGCYTRMTQWDLLPNSRKALDSMHAVTFEIPCDPVHNNNELYYPLRNSVSCKIYASYEADASAISRKVTFAGRTGLFRYLDMVPAVTWHLKMSDKFLKNYL